MAEILSNTEGWVVRNEHGEAVDPRDIVEFCPEENWYKIKKKDAQGNLETAENGPVLLRLYGTVKREIQTQEQGEKVSGFEPEPEAEPIAAEHRDLLPP